MNVDDYKAELRRQLLAATQDRTAAPADPVARVNSPTSHSDDNVPLQPRRWRLLATAAVLIVIAGVATLSLTSGDEARADVQVVVADGYITVTLLDAQTRPEEIQRAAAEYGLDITVTAEPVGAGQVGRFVRTTSSGVPDEARLEGDNGASFNGVRLPLDWDGSLELTLGRAARRGEAWMAAADALAPGGLAACLDVLGAPLEDTVDTLRDRGLDITAFVLDPGEKRLTTPVALRPYRDWQVVSVEAVADNTVSVRATVDGISPLTGEVPAAPENC